VVSVTEEHLRHRTTLLAIALAGIASERCRAQTLAPPKLGGYVQARETAQERVGLTATLNRARFSIEGALPSRFSYRFLVETEATTGRLTPANVSLREAIIRWSPGSFALAAGQFKTPFSREYLVPVPALETPDFAAVVDSLAPKYDGGLMGEYAWGPFATLSAGVFNGEGQNATANRDSTVLLVGRLVVRPVAQLAVGASATRDGADSLRWGVEANVEERGAMARGEYIARHRRDRRRADEDHGWYVLAGFRIVPPFQLIARVEDFQRPALGISRRVHATTFGLIWEIAPNRVRLLLDGMRRASGPRQSQIDALIGQLQIRF
jgi:hypothetical protein